MCLSLKGEFKVKSNRGWKVFIERVCETGPAYFSPYFMGLEHLPDVIYEDKNTDTEFYDGYEDRCRQYQLGYHIFLSKDDALEYLQLFYNPGSLSYVVREVEFSNVVAKGYQEWYWEDGKQIGRWPTVVARQMRILP